MAKKMDIGYKLKKIGELMGERSVFRVGVDIKNNKIDLLSVDACTKDVSKEKAIVELSKETDYIG